MKRLAFQLFLGCSVWCLAELATSLSIEALIINVTAADTKPNTFALNGAAAMEIFSILSSGMVPDAARLVKYRYRL